MFFSKQLRRARRRAREEQQKKSIRSKKLLKEAGLKTDLKTAVEELKLARIRRNLPGTVTGTGKKIEGRWLRGTSRNAGFIPESIANKLRGRTFNSFREFREALYMEIARDPILSKQFRKSDVWRMSQGLGCGS